MMLKIPFIWNHAPTMWKTIQGNAEPIPRLDEKASGDLFAYFYSARFRSLSGLLLETPSPRIPLDQRLNALTRTGIAAQMWNHAPLMAAKTARFDGNEMEEMLSYLWSRQFFSTKGDESRGHRFFIAKGCSNCHDNATKGAPHLPKPFARFNGISMVSALWLHGPAMLGRMQANNIVWPRLETKQMAEIIAYSNAGERK
jgi:hypothetical protein